MGVDGFGYWGSVVVYGVLVLLLSAQLISARLLAALVGSQLVAVLVFALGDRPGAGSLGLGMSTGVILVAMVRSLRGISKPLRQASAG